MSLRDSKLVAWSALLIVIAAIIITISIGIANDIWDYISLFCAFMMVFCRLMALNLKKMSLNAAKKLNIYALVFGILTILSIILLFILFLVN